MTADLVADADAGTHTDTDRDTVKKIERRTGYELYTSKKVV